MRWLWLVILLVCRVGWCVQPIFTDGFGGGAVSDVVSGSAVAVNPQDGSSVVVGHFSGHANFGGGLVSSVAGSSDIFIAKYDMNGAYLWATNMGSSGADAATVVGIDPHNGNVVVGGNFVGTVNFGATSLTAVGQQDSFLAAYDKNGVSLWAKRIGGTSGSDFTSMSGIAVDLGGNITFGGPFFGTVVINTPMTSAGGSDTFLGKFTGNGTFIWQLQFGGTGSETLTGLALDSSTNVVVAGYFLNTGNFGAGNVVSAGGRDIFLAKYPASGSSTPIWANTYGGTGDDIAYAVSVNTTAGAAAQNQIAIAGTYASGSVSFGGCTVVNAGAGNILIVKFDSSGNCIWAKGLEGNSTSGDVAFGVALDDAGNVGVTGNVIGAVDFGGGTSFSNGTYDIFIVEYFSDSTYAWSKRIGRSDVNENANGIAQYEGKSYITGNFAQILDFGTGVPSIVTGTGCFLVQYVLVGQISNYTEAQTFTFTTNSGVGFPHGSVYVSNKLWICTETQPSHLVRFNQPKTLLSDTSVLDFPSDGLHDFSRSLTYIPSKNKFYVIFHGPFLGVVVSEVDPVTMAFTDVIHTATTDSQGEQLCASSTNLFILVHIITGSSGYGGVIKYNLSDFSEAGRVTLGTSGLTGTQPHAMQFDQTNIYITGASSPGWAMKMDPNALTFTSTNFQTGDNLPTDTFAMTSSNLWVGPENATGVLVRVNKGDLSIARISTSIPVSQCFGVFFDGTYMWNEVAFFPGILQRIDPATTNSVFTLMREAQTTEMATDGLNYYVASFTSPMTVVRVSPPSCQPLPVASLPVNQALPWAGAGIPGGISTVTNYPQFASVKATPYNAFGDGVHDDYAAITNAIAACPNSNTLFFPAGTYLVGTNITINKPILLRGVFNNYSLTWASMIKSTGDCATACIDFNIGSSGGTTTTAISSGASAGSVSIVVASAAGFTVGMRAHLNQDYSTAIAPGPVEDSTFARINQYITITNVSGTTIGFTPPLYDNFDATLHPVLEKTVNPPIPGCGMVDLGLDYEGRPDTNGQGVGVRFNHVLRPLVENCLITNAYFESIQVLNSSQGTFEWNYLTHHYPTNNPVFTTSRYEVNFSNFSCDNLFQHNICQAGNTQIILQHGSVGNAVLYNYSDKAWVALNDTDPTDMGAGIGCHGTFPRKNLIEGNLVQNIGADDTWGVNATNTFFRNWSSLRNFINDNGTLSTHGPEAIYLYSTDQIGNNIVGNVASRFTCPAGVMYNIGGSSNTFFHGNFDFVSGATQWSNNICRTFPPSFYYATKPPEFGSMSWPPIGPDVTITSGSLTNAPIIPAQLRYVNSTVPTVPPQWVFRVTNLKVGNANINPK